MKNGQIKNSFNALVISIQDADTKLAVRAGKAVNLSITVRNWIIGLYIHKYELYGTDKAKYGDRILALLAEKLKQKGISNTSKRQLYRYIKFYKYYPELSAVLGIKNLYGISENILLSKVGTASPLLRNRYKNLISYLSYSHIELIADIDEADKRIFYEAECQKGNWSVRELERQINSLYYERTYLSKNKNKIRQITAKKAEKSPEKLNVRDPYVFEFLGLKAREVVRESQVEDAIIDKLQEFLTELGNGFCFEARQKRILIGDSNGFIDLVFYHRIIKCHVLVELKLGEFSHENIGQLNTYVSWYKKNMMEKGDNPPVGILLCTKKDHALAEYALAGMNNKLFVSKYKLELPKKQEMERFIEKQMREMGR